MRGAYRLACCALASVFALFALLPMSGCEDDAVRQSNALRNAVDAEMAAVATGDELPGLLEEASGDELDSLGLDADDVRDAYFSHVVYEIGTVTVDGGTATVEMSVTAPDCKALDTSIRTQGRTLAAGKGVYGYENASDATLLSLIGSWCRDALEDPDLPTQTTDITLTYLLEDDGWVLEDGTPLLEALFPGQGE